MLLPRLDTPEMQELYDSSVAAQEQSGQGADGSSAEASQVPSFDEVKDQLKQQLTSQKENEALTQRMEELREEADIQVNL